MSYFVRKEAAVLSGLLFLRVHEVLEINKKVFKKKEGLVFRQAQRI